ncbi:hypothetical protein Tco_0627260 [Tanacetum coccineum]|uniref:Uncharacterized protein n=1 Tax=Tanacetum coccineum TaxID=301880 RepID=A0ABQ4WM33_9ASTR
MWIRIQDTRLAIRLDKFGNQRAKPKRLETSTYHKGKDVATCKQAEKGCSTSSRAILDWLADTDGGN